MGGTITWFPGVETQLLKGDKGLFIRVPHAGDGLFQTLMPSLTRVAWERLTGEKEFRAATKCEDDASWSAWKEKFSAAEDLAASISASSAKEEERREDPLFGGAAVTYSEMRTELIRKTREALFIEVTKEQVEARWEQLKKVQ